MGNDKAEEIYPLEKYFKLLLQSILKMHLTPSSKYQLQVSVNIRSFPGGSDSKASAYNAGDPGSIPGSGRSPGEENGNPLQYSCLEKSHGRRSLASYTVHRVSESDMTG